LVDIEMPGLGLVWRSSDAVSGRSVDLNARSLQEGDGSTKVGVRFHAGLPDTDVFVLGEENLFRLVV
jgi:hypothetical protein